MADTKLADYPAHLGPKQATFVNHTGPASYTIGGEVLGVANSSSGTTVGGLGALDFVFAGTSSVSGNYFVLAQPSGTGSRKTWNLRWIYDSSSEGVDGAVVVLGSAPTNATYVVTATTGTGQLTIVVAAGALTSVKVTNPGIYEAAPTFTPPAGLGSGATITATIGSVFGEEVGATVNLSGETVTIGYLGR